MIQKLSNFLHIDKYIIKWIIISFGLVYVFMFFAYVNNHAKDGIYSEQDWGSRKGVREILNPYINIYNIYKEKSDSSEFNNKINQVGYGFVSTDKDSGGSIVVMVTPGSPAEKSGLLEGDIIKTADGISILNDHQLSQLIDPKDSILLKIDRTNKVIDISITKGPFMSEAGLKVGSNLRAPTSDKIPNGDELSQVNYGLGRLKSGLIEYRVEGISLFGAMLIALLWAVTILPVLLVGTLLYRLLSKIRYKIFIIIINIILIPTIMCGTIILIYQNPFFDEMVRASANSGGGFIDLSGLIYPIVAFLLSVFLVIGYTITLYVYKKHILKMDTSKISS